MKYIAEWVENKNNDWKIATLVSLDGKKQEGVSINRTNKKGEVFPNFDGITPGTEVDGEPWQSSAGKWYLFAPKVEKTWSAGANSRPRGNMNAAIEKKQEGIKVAQENKENGIKVSSTIRMAVDLAVAELGQGATESLEEKITYWRQWLWGQWEKSDKDYPPFN